MMEGASTATSSSMRRSSSDYVPSAARRGDAISSKLTLKSKDLLTPDEAAEKENNVAFSAATSAFLGGKDHAAYLDYFPFIELTADDHWSRIPNHLSTNWHRLALAIFSDVAQRCSAWSKQCPEVKRELIGWINDDDMRYPFSLGFMCEMFDFDIGWIRAKLFGPLMNREISADRIPRRRV